MGRPGVGSMFVWLQAKPMLFPITLCFLNEDDASSIQHHWKKGRADRWIDIETDRQMDRQSSLCCHLRHWHFLSVHFPNPPAPCSPIIFQWLTSALSLMPYHLSLNSNLGLCEDNYSQSVLRKRYWPAIQPFISAGSIFRLVVKWTCI